MGSIAVISPKGAEHAQAHLVEAVRWYEQASFIPIGSANSSDVQRSIRLLLLRWGSGAIVIRLLYDNDVYAGVMVSAPSFDDLSGQQSMHQLHMSVRPGSAREKIKRMLVLHNDLLEICVKRGVPVATSCSTLSNSEVFKRVLLSNGWEPVGPRSLVCRARPALSTPALGARRRRPLAG